MVRLPMVFPQRFSPSHLLSRHWGWLAVAMASLGSLSSLPVNVNSSVVAQTAPSSPMTVRSDIQEANSQTGVVTARGNVQVYYPARNLQATAAQAQYFSQERRLVLSGNVYVLQDGNSMRAETMTYLVDEGRFVANPQANQQVESIYLVEESQSPAGPAPTGPNPLPGDTLPDLPPLGS
ncbi:LptA/OstA family protein [Synechocystis sp. CACIAM 05]|uniref:LptA/OstA family protein n=1 Tax=Synechocystis sp. CACIAM 05 TaxID=1933929 RepID=UPI00138E9291|nr:LptA/OstA family protein [Synechocystis sp. CACIAM 05]QHU98730.1 ostA-like family protein [Synechocystis sp. CACIAM 05]